MKKPLALDLCCGRGGWSAGLLDAGWDVIGVDIEDMGGNPERAKLVIADILEIAKDAKAFFPGLKFDLVVASPPCQAFSYRSFPFKRCVYLRDNVPPNTDIWRACEKIAHDLGAPLVLENVRGAERYMGKAKGRFGPFYLWGDVPVLLPDGRPQKGFGKSYANADRWASKKVAIEFAEHRDRKFAGECEGVDGGVCQSRGKRGPLNGKRITHSKDGHKRIGGAADYGSIGSNARKEWSAKAAMIPLELSFHIGSVFNPGGIPK